VLHERSRVFDRHTKSLDLDHITNNLGDKASWSYSFAVIRPAVGRSLGSWFCSKALVNSPFLELFMFGRPWPVHEETPLGHGGDCIVTPLSGGKPTELLCPANLSGFSHFIRMMPTANYRWFVRTILSSCSILRSNFICQLRLIWKVSMREGFRFVLRGQSIKSGLKSISPTRWRIRFNLERHPNGGVKGKVLGTVIPRSLACLVRTPTSTSGVLT